MQSKLVILKSLASFLRHAISPSTNREGARNSDHETISTWYLSSAFSSPQAFDEFDNLLKPSLASSVSSKISMRQRYWEPEATPDTTTEGALGLFPLAHSILVDAWSLRDLSDAASSSMNSEDAHTAVTVVSINIRSRLLI
jgi:pre-rRNA-processing protein IPI1